MTNDQGISIVIPAYDEQDAVGGVLRDIISTMDASGLAYEILVVDDGSTDGTGEVIRQVAGVRLIQHDNNKGYGASLKTGIRHAAYPWVCITDADGTYPNHMIPQLAMTA